MAGPQEQPSRPAAAPGHRHLGVPVRRREDAVLLTGEARTVADLVLPGLVELAFVRSELPHALVTAVDAAPARDVQGVAGAWSAADLPDLPAVPDSLRGGQDDAGSGPDRSWPGLATDRVRYPGQPLAVVAAASRAVAEDAAERVRPVLRELPSVTDPREAVADGAPQLYDGAGNVALTAELGTPADEAEAVFASAPVVVEAEFRQQLLLPTSLEARAIAVQPSPDGGLTVWVSSQAPHRLRDALASAFSLPAEQVRVVVPWVGGAFGAKSQVYPEHLLAAHLARRLGRPVRWVEDRSEAMLCATRGRGQHQRTRLAADEDGRFLAYELDVVADVGGYPQTGAMVPLFTAQMAPGLYRTPHVRARVRSVLTNTAPTSAYRGAGRPEAACAIERTVDVLARRLGVDPAELRRRNHLRPDELPHDTPTGRRYDSGDYAATLDVALRAVAADDVRAEQARRRASGGRPLGLGLATYVERSGGLADQGEHGSVTACPDGTFEAATGSQSTGQGHLTSFAQVVAEALGVDLDRVRVVQGDTSRVPEGTGSFGSRSMQVGGAALWQASRALVDEARAEAAAVLGVPLDAVRWDDGVLTAGERSLPVGELAARRAAAGRPLVAQERAVLPEAFPFGAYAAVVELDPQLGTVSVQRLVAVDDYGFVVNPLVVEGQGYGSVAQGLGQALYEEAVLDDAGRPYARSLLDYLLPTAADLPPVVLEETESPNPDSPFGAKGAGEAGCIGAPPAVANAVLDALVQAGVDVDAPGVRLDLPLTPDRVWRALQAAG